MQNNEKEQELLVYGGADTKKKRKSPVKWGLLVLAIIAAAIVIVLLINNDTDYEVDTNAFAQGVHVLDCDLSGMTMDEARKTVENTANQKIMETEIRYRIGDSEYSISGQQADMEIDYEKALEQAFQYAKSDDPGKNRDELKYAAESGMLFPCDVSVDEIAVKSEVQKNDPFSGTATGSPENGTIKKIADEETKVTGYEIRQEKTEVNTTRIDAEKLTSDIVDALENFEDETVLIAAEKATDEQIQTVLEVIGSYQTKITHPELDSAYNIWKASDRLNTMEIKPGETWSMKDALGTLNMTDGWKSANELIDKKTQSVPGGGINHLASTIYAAALKSELDVEQRIARPWPASYIDPGLDADVFSKNADLKIKNSSEAPIFFVIECKATEGTLTASFLGNPFDDGLTREIAAETVTEENDLGGKTVKVSLEKKDAEGEITDTRKLYEDKYQAQETAA